MDEVRVDQVNYQMPPREGFTVAHFLTGYIIEVGQSKPGFAYG